MQAPEHLNKPTRPLSYTEAALAILALVVAALLAIALFLPISAGDRRSLSTFALSNTKQCGLSLYMYVIDHDDRNPPVDQWSDAVLPYVKRKEVFSIELRDEQGWVSSTMNGLLDRKPVAEPDKLKDLAALFETRGKTWNAWGGPAGAWKGHGKTFRVAVGFVDGHAKLIERPKLRTLRWRP